MADEQTGAQITETTQVETAAQPEIKTEVKTETTEKPTILNTTTEEDADKTEEAKPITWGEDWREKYAGEDEKVLKEVFAALKRENVMLNYAILKPSMVISGKEAGNRAGVDEVARQTIKCLKATVPAELPSINFLSGGQTPQEATAHLNRMHTIEEDLPWYVSFSYARALQDPALKAWQGKKENFGAGQRAFIKRAKLNSLATMGKYTEDMENKDLSMAAVQ